MDQFIESLPLVRKIGIYLSSGLVLVTLILIVPKSWLVWLGKLKYGTPNHITFYRLPLSWFAYAVYFNYDYFVGYLMVVAVCTLDRIDGKQAYALKALGDPRYPGLTPKGEWLDPLIDKLTVLGMLIIFGQKGFLWWSVLILLLLIEVTGTLIRPPFNECRPLEWTQQRVRLTKASWVGKVKFTAQVAAMLVCLPLHQEWCAYLVIWPNVILIIATFLALLSVVSRFRINKKVDQWVDRVTVAFGHQ